MGYKVDWADAEHTIIRERHFGEAQISEYYEALKEVRALFANTTHPIDIIVDVRDLKSDLRGLLTGIQYANKSVPENQRLVVVVGATMFLKALANVASKVAPKATNNLSFVESMEEAHILISEYRAALNSPPELKQ